MHWWIPLLWYGTLFPCPLKVLNFQTSALLSTSRPCTYIIMISHGPVVRYGKLRVAHAPRMPGTFFPPLCVSDPDMHHGTCVTHMPWCMPGGLTSGFLRWRGKHSRHSRRMPNPQFYVSGKRPMAWKGKPVHKPSTPIVTESCIPVVMGRRSILCKLWIIETLSFWMHIHQHDNLRVIPFKDNISNYNSIRYGRNHNDFGGMTILVGYWW